MHFDYDAECNAQVVEKLAQYKDKFCVPDGNINPEFTLKYIDSLEGIENLSPSYGLYIIASNLFTSMAKLLDLPSPEGEHILTIVGESKLLYSSKFSLMISQFLYSEAYLSKSQSQRYFTAVQEGLLNAIEHGNLGLSRKKTESIQQNNWFDTYHGLSKNVLNNKSFGGKLIVFQCYLNESHIVSHIVDEGEGFAFKKCNLKNTENLPHGRGLELVKNIADELSFKGCGNCMEFKLLAKFTENHAFSQKLHIESLQYSTKILIVDDEPSNLKIAEFHLKSAGYKNIHLAISGEEALKIAGEIIPDLIILDIIMPGINGFKTFRKIKQLERCANIPILFFTGLDDVKNRVKGYRLGAVDYVTKPIQPNELVARANVHVQYSVMLKSLNKSLDRIQKDLNRAKVSQLDLLPSKDDIEMLQVKYKLDINSCFCTCEELAGDYWTVFDIGCGKLGIILADFAGHGIAASLNTVRLHALVQGASKLYNNPEQFIFYINTKLKKLISLESFATFVYVIFDTYTGDLTYIGCGNPPIAILPNDSLKKCRYLSCMGIPLGLVDNDVLELNIKHDKITKGESLFLFSDALIETVHANTQEMWCEKGLQKELNKLNLNNKTSKLQDILDVHNATAQMPLKDDLTLVHINYRDGKASKEFLHNYTSSDALHSELAE